jgi:hypothetical protein
MSIIPHLSIRSLRKEDEKIKMEWQDQINQLFNKLKAE